MSKVLIQIQKQIPVSIDTDVFIGDHKVIIDEAVICGGLTDIKGRIDSKPIPQTKEVEWVNGDECRYNDVNWLFCGFHPTSGLAIVANNDEPSMHQVITVDVTLLFKPETEAERVERERLENGEALFNFSEESAEKAGGIMLSTPWEDQTQASKDYWVMFAKQLGYRKESE